MSGGGGDQTLGVWDRLQNSRPAGVVEIWPANGRFGRSSGPTRFQERLIQFEIGQMHRREFTVFLRCLRCLLFKNGSLEPEQSEETEKGVDWR